MQDTTKQVGWNNIQLTVPSSWEVIVSGARHLLFEDDFQPQLQCRWEHTTPLTKKQIADKGARLWPREWSTNLNSDFSHSSQEAARHLGIFSYVNFYNDESGMLNCGICYSANHNVLLIFQVLNQEKELSATLNKLLHSIKWYNKSAEKVPWQVQDFQLSLPPDYTLKNFTFRAGLTRLAFVGPGYSMEICKLAPADLRLKQQSLSTILETLSGAHDMVIVEDSLSCSAHRFPNLWKQIRYRLKRQQPFIRVKLWHDDKNNRLLAIFLFSKKYIAEQSLNDHCLNYEIIADI